MNRTLRNLIIVGATLLVLIIAALSTFQTVQEGTVGVVRTFGKVQEAPLMPGFHVINPITTNVEEITTKLESVSVKVDSASSDLQRVTTEITVNINVVPPMAPILASRVGDLAKATQVILYPGIQESVKAVTAKYRAENLITQREAVRTDVTEAVRKFVNNLLESRELNGAIVIQSVALTDFQFSPQFNEGVEKKVIAEQLALQAENEKRQRITQAEATQMEAQLATDAEVYQLTKRAEANALAITSESEARAEALLRESDALAKNERILELRRIETWDGKMPLYVAGDSQALLQIPAPKTE